MSARLETENETLRRRLADVEGMLRERELAECHRLSQAEVDRLAAEQAAAAAEQAGREAEDLEAHRRRAWYDYTLEKLIAADDNDGFREFLRKSPEQHQKDAPPGWPVGVDPSQFQSVSAFAPEPDGKFEQTLLGQALLAKGIRL